MKKKPQRFHPPARVSSSPPLLWVLSRAFASASRWQPVDLDGDAALEIARQLDLAARIGHRVSGEALERDLGRRTADQFATLHQQVAANNFLLTEIARDVCEAARALGTRVALLKYFGLLVHGGCEVGERQASDVDALIPEQDLERLAAALRARGFWQPDVFSAEHQLGPLVHPRGRAVELHRHIFGLAIGDDRGPAGFASLDRAGLLVPVRGDTDVACVLSRDALTAHILVHGLLQHGPTTGSYPMMRVLADLAGLGVHRDAGAPERLAAFTGGRLGADEIRVVLAVLRALEEGRAEDLLAAGDLVGEAVLLRHLLGVHLDAGYRESLRLSAWWNLPDHRPRFYGLARMAASTVFLTRDQVDLLYGRQRAWHGYLKWRLWRPFDVIGRLAAAIWAYWRFRLREWRRARGLGQPGSGR